MIGARGNRRFATVAPDQRARAALPLWSWGIPSLDAAADVQAGELVYVAGAPGTGKTSLLLQVARHHERELGPALYVAAEIDGITAGARIVSQVDGVSWRAALRDDTGRVERVLSSMPRLYVNDDRSEAWSDAIEAWLVAMAAEHPGRVPLVAVDYLQRLAGGPRDPREHAGDASNRLRMLANRHNAVVAAASKVSREAAKKLRSGAMRGAAALEAGAESNAIEFDGAVVLVLGKKSPLDRAAPDGPAVVEASIAKTRFGASDKVVDLVYDGRTGRFADHGNAAAAGVAAKRERLATIARTLDTPITRSELAKRIGGRGEVAFEVIKDGIAAGVVITSEDGKRLIGASAQVIP